MAGILTLLDAAEIIAEGEANGGARGGGEDEYGEEGRRGVDLIIQAASSIDKEEQIKGHKRTRNRKKCSVICCSSPGNQSYHSFPSDPLLTNKWFLKVRFFNRIKYLNIELQTLESTEKVRSAKQEAQHKY